MRDRRPAGLLLGTSASGGMIWPLATAPSTASRRPRSDYRAHGSTSPAEASPGRQRRQPDGAWVAVTRAGALADQGGLPPDPAGEGRTRRATSDAPRDPDHPVRASTWRRSRRSAIRAALHGRRGRATSSPGGRHQRPRPDRLLRDGHDHGEAFAVTRAPGRGRCPAFSRAHPRRARDRAGGRSSYSRPPTAASRRAWSPRHQASSPTVRGRDLRAPIDLICRWSADEGRRIRTGGSPQLVVLAAITPTPAFGDPSLDGDARQHRVHVGAEAPGAERLRSRPTRYRRASTCRRAQAAGDGDPPFVSLDAGQASITSTYRRRRRVLRR